MHSLCVCVCVRAHTCMCVHACVRWVCVCVCACVVCVCVCVCVCVHASLCVRWQTWPADCPCCRLVFSAENGTNLTSVDVQARFQMVDSCKLYFVTGLKYWVGISRVNKQMGLKALNRHHTNNTDTPESPAVISHACTCLGLRGSHKLIQRYILNKWCVNNK